MIVVKKIPQYTTRSFMLYQSSGIKMFIYPNKNKANQGSSV